MSTGRLMMRGETEALTAELGRRSGPTDRPTTEPDDLRTRTGLLLAIEPFKAFKVRRRDQRADRSAVPSHHDALATVGGTIHQIRELGARLRHGHRVIHFSTIVSLYALYGTRSSWGADRRPADLAVPLAGSGSPPGFPHRWARTWLRLARAGHGACKRYKASGALSLQVER
jgi:hypothetical protein